MGLSRPLGPSSGKLTKAHAHFGATPAEGFAHFYKIRPEETREAYLRDMIWCSEEIKAAWDAVNLIAQDLLGEGKPLPPELAEWTRAVLDDVLAGRKSRPTTRGRDPDANHVRDRAIVDAVQWLLTLEDFKATRRRFKGGKWLPAQACVEGGSACDAVGVAAGLSYSNVERIWLASASPDSAIARRQAARAGTVSGSPPGVGPSEANPTNI